MKTTLKKVQEHFPHKTSYPDALLVLYKNIGKTTADDDLSILTILDSMGLDWTLWNLRTIDNQDKVLRLFAIWCARQVHHLMTDERSLVALDLAEKYAHGMANQEELASAEVDARKASLDAARESEVASAKLNALHQVAKKDSSWANVWDPVSEANHCSALRASSYAAKAAQGAAMHAGVCGSYVSDAGVAAHDAAQAAYKAIYHATAINRVTICASIWRACQDAEAGAKLAQEQELRRICASQGAHT